MCVQLFVHFAACTHAMTKCKLCEHARAILEFNPFYAPCMCEHYERRSKTVDRACGDLGNYCAQAPEAEWLNKWHSQLKAVELQIIDVQARVMHVGGMRNHLVQASRHAGRPDGLLEKDVNFMQLRNIVMALKAEQNQYASMRNLLGKYINHAMAHYHHTPKDARVQMPYTPPMPPTTGQPTMPPVMEQHVVQRDRATSLATAMSSSASRVVIDPKTGFVVNPSSVQRQDTRTNVYSPQTQASRPAAQLQHNQASISEESTSRPATTGGRRGRQRKVEQRLEPSPEGAIRRSTRARDKTVKYAESNSSSPTSSRTHSPAKSEAEGSNFSPQRSSGKDTPEETESPGSWERRPGFIPVDDGNVIDNARPSTAGSPPAARRRKPTFTPRASGLSRVSTPPQLTQSTAQPATVPEPITTSRAYSQHLSFSSSPATKRRADSAFPVFTPPTAAAHLAAIEPEKRSMPPSSPLVPSSKRMRLSLGLEHTITTATDVDQSPAGKHIHDDAMMQRTDSAYGGAAMPALQPFPAPSLAPAAIMYMPGAGEDDADKGLYELPTVPLPGSDADALSGSAASTHPGSGDVGGVGEFDYSDIDWSLLNDDIFGGDG